MQQSIPDHFIILSDWGGGKLKEVQDKTTYFLVDMQGKNPTVQFAWITRQIGCRH